MIDDISIGLYQSATNMKLSRMIEILHLNEEEHRKSYDSNKMYQKTVSWKRDGKILALQTWKKRDIYWGPDHILAFHCSKFEDFKEMYNWLDQMLGPYMDYVERAKIIRLDCCFETSDLSIDDVWLKMRRKYSQDFNTKWGWA